MIAGDHLPVVRVKNIGKVDPGTVTAINFPLTVTSATSNTNHNLGGYDITLAGTGFPMKADSVSITLCSKQVKI